MVDMSRKTSLGLERMMVIPLYGKNMTSFMASDGKRKVLLLGRIVDPGFISVLLLKQQGEKRRRKIQLR